MLETQVCDCVKSVPLPPALCKQCGAAFRRGRSLFPGALLWWVSSLAEVWHVSFPNRVILFPPEGGEDYGRLIVGFSPAAACGRRPPPNCHRFELACREFGTESCVVSIPSSYLPPEAEAWRLLREASGSPSSLSCSVTVENFRRVWPEVKDAFLSAWALTLLGVG